MKTYARWLVPTPAERDPRRCRVCGHRSVPPARRRLNLVLVMLLGVLIAYIVLDVASDGRLDGSLYRAIRAEFAAGHARVP
jgi:hypothetical protein